MAELLTEKIIIEALEADGVSQKIDNLDRSCSRMDDHIDFVERTYDVLRSPLSLLTNISSRFYSSVEDDNLPQLENRNV